MMASLGLAIGSWLAVMVQKLLKWAVIGVVLFFGMV